MKDISSTVTAGGSAQVLSADNINRRYLFVQNISDIDLWVSEVGDAAADSPSMKIPPGSVFELIGVPARGAWSIFGATTAKKFVGREA